MYDNLQDICELEKLLHLGRDHLNIWGLWGWGAGRFSTQNIQDQNIPEKDIKDRVNAIVHF